MRRFRAYTVGLPRSGTGSVAAIFGAYRSAHEARARQVLSAVAGGGDLPAVLLARDEEAGLEMDSASFHHHYPGFLAGRFPEARFLFTVRDWRPWAESFLHLLLWLRPMLRPWMHDYLRGGMGLPLESRDLASPDDMAAALPRMVGPLLDFWAEANARVLDHLPSGRSLILRTDELSSSLEALAALVGVPPSSLQPAHRNRGGARPPLLESLPSGWLAAEVETRCGPVRARLFPELAR
jgi:hypothetical protein